MDSCTIDWLSFTVRQSGDKSARDGAPIPESLDWLVPFTKPSCSGKRGYTHSDDLPGGGFVAFTFGREDIHVSLPSSALAALSLGLSADETTDDNRGLEFINSNILFSRLHDSCATITRLDVAFDDRSGSLSMSVIADSLHRRDFESRWKSANEVRSLFVNDSAMMPGRTFYVGSRSSDAFLRVYDKRAEVFTKSAGETDPGAWVRLELEMKHDRADYLFHELALMPAADRAAHCVALLAGYIDFKVSGIERIDTRPSVDWWSSFLDGSDSLRLSLPSAPARTLDDVRRWLRDQVSASLATVLTADDGDMSFVLMMADLGKGKMAKRHELMISADRAGRLRLPDETFSAHSSVS